VAIIKKQIYPVGGEVTIKKPSNSYRELAINILLLLFSILLVLVIFELILNIPYFDDFFDFWVHPNRIFYVNNSNRIYLDKIGSVDFNNIDFHNLYFHPNFKEEHNCTNIEKDNSTFRIIFIGDSMTYGQGIPRENVFTYLLSEKLNKNNQVDYEIFNFGVIRYNLPDLNFLLNDQVIDCEPDLVIYSFFHNDLQGSALSASFFIPYFKYRYSTNKFHHLKSYYYISQKVINRFTNLFDVNKDLNNTKHLRGIVRLSARENISLLIINIPNNDEGFSSYNFTKVFYEKYKNKGINYLDLRNKFIERDLDYKKISISNSDTHYSFQGHRVVAEILYDYLIKFDILKNE